MPWNTTWLQEEKPSIEYLELYAVAVGIMLWIHKFKNGRVLLHCDNESVCRMLNKSPTSCRNCMILIRLIVMECLRQNVHVTAEWVSTGDNGKADALSRMDIKRFHRLGKNMDVSPTALPQEIWPIQKIWQKIK